MTKRIIHKFNLEHVILHTKPMEGGVEGQGNEKGSCGLLRLLSLLLRPLARFSGIENSLAGILSIFDFSCRLSCNN